MKQRLKPYNKRKPFKRKNGGARFMLGSAGAKFNHSKSSEARVSSALASFIDSIFGERQKRIRSSIKRENKEITKES
jgi:hypothetical protein